MKIAMIGLGKMGGFMTQRLIGAGHEVVAYDLSEDARRQIEAKGATAVADLKDLKDTLPTPRIAWVMVPAGEATNSTINALKDIFDEGDVIIDGGNSNYKDAKAIADNLLEKKIDFIDAGTSGGVWGLDNGYCLMVGGTKEAVAKTEPIFKALAPPDGYAHVGPVGAGHFVKMVHNGIEYGMLQAYGEGFAIMEAADEFNLDMHQIASIWRYGSVVRSWLLELLELALRNPEEFDKIEGIVVDSGEGRWTALEAIDRGVPAPIITASLFERFSSRKGSEFSNRIIAALRNQFGGHAVVKED